MIVKIGEMNICALDVETMRTRQFLNRIGFISQPGVSDDFVCYCNDVIRYLVSSKEELCIEW